MIQSDDIRTKGSCCSGERPVSITVQLEPDVEARLLARARAQGMSLDAYVRTVMEQMAAVGGPPELSLEEFEAGLDALAEGCEKLPVLPPDAYRRESIYGDE
jgi:hypothetical protein